MDPGRVGIHVIEEGRTGGGLVPVRVASGEEALVSPPDVQPPPVDGIPGRRGGEFGKNLRSDAASGQHHRRGAPGGDRVDQPGDQAGGDGLSEQRGIAVHDDLGHAH